MKTNVSPLLSLAVLVTATACNSSPLARSEAAFDRTAQVLCSSCPQVAGVLTTAECLARVEMNDPFEGPSWECQEDAYALYPSELGPYYDCIAGVVERYESCVRRALDTCPPPSGVTMACNDALAAGIAACPRPTSSEANTALAACFR